jgi:hypothetical protein
MSKLIANWDAYQTSRTNNMIITSPYKHNGQVDILTPETHEERIKMTERIALKNKPTDFRDALGGNWEKNILSDVYFSAGNIQILQNGLRAGVYELSKGKFVVPPQNVDNLKIIMRSTFLQYAQFDMKNVTNEVERLNKIVLGYAIPSLYGDCVSYSIYAQDQSTLVMPIDLPVQNDRNYKTLELKPWV